MKLDFESSEKTGRFVVRNGKGRMLFETYNLNRLERRNLIELLSHVRDTSYDEGLRCERRTEPQAG